MTDVAATQSRFAALANPTRFIALAGAILPWLATLTALCLAAGIYMSFTTEGDYQQGETVRIMYVHVPAAWLSMMCYTIMAISALGTLVWRHPLARRNPPRRSAPPSPFWHSSPARSGASRCGARGGSGMRG